MAGSGGLARAGSSAKLCELRWASEILIALDVGGGGQSGESRGGKIWERRRGASSGTRTGDNGGAVNSNRQYGGLAALQATQQRWTYDPAHSAAAEQRWTPFVRRATDVLVLRAASVVANELDSVATHSAHVQGESGSTDDGLGG